jgi:hypothetical protein
MVPKPQGILLLVPLILQLRRLSELANLAPGSRRTLAPLCHELELVAQFGLAFVSGEQHLLVGSLAAAPQCTVAQG